MEVKLSEFLPAKRNLKRHVKTKKKTLYEDKNSVINKYIIWADRLKLLFSSFYQLQSIKKLIYKNKPFPRNSMTAAWKPLKLSLGKIFNLIRFYKTLQAFTKSINKKLKGLLPEFQW